MAGAIERALDAQEREEFWARAAATMATADAQRWNGTDTDSLAGTLKDGLDPNETWDDVW